MTLFFIFMTGCDACAEAKPALDAFAAKFPDIEITKIDLTMEEWPDDAIVDAPDSVPAYALRDGRLTRTLQSRGALTAEELELWVFGPGGAIPNAYDP